jgi:hypothetical protein
VKVAILKRYRTVMYRTVPLPLPFRYRLNLKKMPRPKTKSKLTLSLPEAIINLKNDTVTVTVHSFLSRYGTENGTVTL